jgi:rod shape-determining protein MreB
MLGRTPLHIVAVQPLVDGVISDFEVTEEMLAYLLNKAQGNKRRLLGPRIVIGVPSGVTSVEVRAVRDVARNAGAREVHVVEEPMAAAIGIRLPVSKPSGSMIIDIGGGTTNIGLISLGGIVNSRNIKVGGDRFNADISSYIRNEHKILVGDRSAEDLKISVGSVIPGESPLTASVRGRDLVTGLPREVIVTDADVRSAMEHSIDELIEAVKEVIETTPPEVLSDVMRDGIHLTGGGALIRGFPEVLSATLGVPVRVAQDPLTAVVRGTGFILDDIDAYREALLTADDDFVPTQ